MNQSWDINVAWKLSGAPCVPYLYLPNVAKVNSLPSMLLFSLQRVAFRLKSERLAEVNMIVGWLVCIGAWWRCFLCDQGLYGSCCGRDQWNTPGGRPADRQWAEQILWITKWFPTFGTPAAQLFHYLFTRQILVFWQPALAFPPPLFSVPLLSCSVVAVDNYAFIGIKLVICIQLCICCMHYKVFQTIHYLKDAAGGDGCTFICTSCYAWLQRGFVGYSTSDDGVPF